MIKKIWSLVEEDDYYGEEINTVGYFSSRKLAAFAKKKLKNHYIKLIIKTMIINPDKIHEVKLPITNKEIKLFKITE